MITEDYVSFEIAKLLKEKGFDGECQGYYEIPTKLSSQKGVRKQLNVLPKNWNEYNKECVVCEYISISTHQMALKWLREVHKINIVIGVASDDDNLYSLWKFDIWNGNYSIIWGNKREKFNSYEQAVEAACLYVLKNLI